MNNRIPVTTKNGAVVAFGALLGCGILLGLSINLAKVASNLGMTALPFLTWSLAGATVLLFIVSILKKQAPPTSVNAVKYYLISAFFSVAGSNLIFFSAVPHVGVSFVALTTSLPPLLTYIVALLLRMEAYNHWRAAGVGLALGGTGLLVISKLSTPNSSQFWVLLTLIGPVLLAVGNIYRTTHWPKGAKPESLAPGMLLAAIMILSFAGIFSAPVSPLSASIGSLAVLLILLQSVVFAGQFLLLFVLQQVGGPVFLSLIGAVGAAFGVPFAVILLDEPMLIVVIPSGLLILLGILCMIKGQSQLKNI